MQKQSIQSLILSNISSCDKFDIELIISYVLKKDRVFTITHSTQILTKKQVDKINELCAKRANGYPIAYMFNEKEFYGRSFKVTQDTLIPRPETEILIESVLELISENKLNNVLIIDIGTGSGIIPITLSKEIPSNISTQILATDISPKALDIAQHNTQKHNESNIAFYKSDLLNSKDLIHDISNSSYDYLIITANLPYVNTSMKNYLLQKKESISLKYEPQIALWSDDFGLNHYKQLLTQTLQLNTVKQITSFYEISPEQYSLLKSHLEQNISNPNIKLHKDLARKERIVQLSINA